MFKVICISPGNWVEIKPTKKHWWNRPKQQEASGPKKDDIVTVIKEYYSEGQKYYCLLEWPATQTGAYAAKYFRLLEDKFEKVTFKEIKEKAGVN